MEITVKEIGNIVAKCKNYKPFKEGFEYGKKVQKEIDAEAMEELKIFRELYPDIDVESSLRKNYELGVNDFVDYLNKNAFELRHDMELIKEYAEKFLTR